MADRPTDRATDRQTDIATYRAAIAANNSNNNHTLPQHKTSIKLIADRQTNRPTL